MGRAELLASVLYLLALLSYSKSSKKGKNTRWRQLMWTLTCTTLAMLSKEQGITVVAVCATYELFINQKLSLKDLTAFPRSSTSHWSPKKSSVRPSWVYSVQRICVLIASALALLLVRMKVMGARLPVFTKFDNPAAASPAPTKQLTMSYLISVNAWLLMSPCDLCCDWTMNTVPLVTGLSDPRNLATLATFGTCLALIWSAWSTKSQRHSSIVIVSLAMTIFPFLPASNFFFPVGFVVAERKFLNFPPLRCFSAE